MLGSRTLGARLKCELFQRTGSFKARGALNKLSSLDADERARGVIAISAGNHAQAVAYAAAEDGRRRARRDVGGRVRAEDRGDARLRRRRSTSRRRARRRRSSGSTQLLEETGRTLVHPFDDPVVIAGAGTVGLEIEEDAPDADVVIVAVGGGGLDLRDRRRARRPAMRDRRRRAGDEPRASTRRSRPAHPVPVEPRSIADGLNAPFAGALPIELCRDLERVLVTEEEIEDAFRFLYERAKLACEPAGAAAAAALLAGKVQGRAPGRRSSAAATSPRRPPLVSWPDDEGRHPSRVRPLDGALLVRELVRDPFDVSRS